jgi:transcriptional regulator with XRE-family HTH domain
MRITGFHIRLARAALNWSIATLAAKTGLSPATITRIETGAVKAPNKANLKLLTMVFEAEGIEFVSEAEREGVLLRRK